MPASPTATTTRSILTSPFGPDDWKNCSKPFIEPALVRFHFEEVNNCVKKLKPCETVTQSNQIYRPLLPCCPLFEPTEEDLFSQVATGTLLKVQNKHFMLTAGHVCDQHAESNFLFASAEGFSILHGEVAIGDRGRGDIYDFGYVLLDEPVAQQMKHFFTFVTPKNIDVNEYALEGDWYSFSGFPYRKRKIRGKQISSPLFSYHLQAAPKQAYYDLDVNPYSHIICNFNRERYVTPEGRSTTAPLPHGLSGGPIINYTKEVDPRTTPTTKKLAGICTEHHAKTNLLIGVRIAGFVRAILHRHPELTEEFEKIELLT